MAFLYRRVHHKPGKKPVQSYIWWLCIHNEHNTKRIRFSLRTKSKKVAQRKALPYLNFEAGLKRLHEIEKERERLRSFIIKAMAENVKLRLLAETKTQTTENDSHGSQEKFAIH